ncbi:MAG: hypothetical protein ABI698_10515 [bacterium]
MIDWQTFVVGFILLGAALYLSWRGWLRISSLLTSKQSKVSACGGCGGCGASKSK